MLTELCAELKNYFIRDIYEDIHYGWYTISNGSIDLPYLIEGQYFRIVGSVLNDGVYQYPVTKLSDEEFTGAVWAMAVPPAVVALADEIKAWNEENAEIISSPFSSESFGGYSYNKTSVYGGGESQIMTWKVQFASRLSKWRRLSVL